MVENDFKSNFKILASNALPFNLETISHFIASLSGKDTTLESQRKKIETEIFSTHRDYVECMTKIISFANKHGKSNYGSIFLQGMQAADERTSEIVEVNYCREITMDWWRKVARFSEVHGVNPVQFSRFSARYSVFVAYVPRIKEVIDKNDELEDSFLFEYGSDLAKMPNKNNLTSSTN